MDTENFETIFQLLESRSEVYPNHGITYYTPASTKKPGRELKYSELHQNSIVKANTLRQIGLKPGKLVLLHFDNNVDNIEWFWAAVAGEFIPILSTPFTNNLEHRRKHILHLHTVLNDPLCLTSRKLLSEFAQQDLLRLQTIEDLPLQASNGHHCEMKSISAKNSNGHAVGEDQNHRLISEKTGDQSTQDAIAAMMLTSGSTGNAKVVVLTHKQIMTSIAGKTHTHNSWANGVFLNWIGVDHVACLTEIHLHALWAGAPQVFVQAADLVPNPLWFLDLIERHSVTNAFAPNFFLAALKRALETPEHVGSACTWNLACLLTIVTGGEANVVETCNMLSGLLQRYGAAGNVLSPAFGMTETCGGAIYSRDCPRKDLECKNEFASVGSCIPGMQMRITGERGNDLGRGKPGNLEVSGPIVFKQYYNNVTATQESFNDGWFITGDRGYIDMAGHLNLTGRAKETVIINGVKYLPHEIESALEDIEGTISSYTVVFPNRPKGSETERMCVVYRPTYNEDDTETRVATNDTISKAVMLQTGARPYVLPLDSMMLQKTTLGKLSRVKIQAAFEKDDYSSYQSRNDEAVTAFRISTYEGPTNETEALILEVFKDVFECDQYDLGVNTNLFAMGVDSISLIKVKQKLQIKMDIENIPIITIMTNPTIRSLSVAICELQGNHEYNPMVVLQSQGEKSPLWLIHPGVGEVLIFLALGSHVTDRPVYAMRARGFEDGEEYFSCIEEVVTTYHSKIKSVQPEGPYAIAGYSYGSMIAFEIVKLLNKHGDEVKFLGAFNLPPHIKFRMRQLDWTNCLLHLSYFLDFFSEDYAFTMHPSLKKLPREEVLDHVMSVAPMDRLQELGLDRIKLTNWADLAYSLQSSAIDYEPSGMVESIDVFCAVPLAAVADGMEDWKTNHLSKWADFSRTKPRMHEVDGAHYTMISQTNVYSFQKILRSSLAARGI